MPTPRPSDTAASATISVSSTTRPGILARVVGLFSGRGYNIESLTVRRSPKTERRRITVVTSGTDDGHRADQGAARPAGAGAQGHRPHRRGPACRARAGAGQGRRQRREADRGAAPRRYLPRPGDRRDDRELRLRDDRRDREESTAFIRPDASHRAGRWSSPTGVVARSSRAEASASAKHARSASIASRIAITHSNRGEYRCAFITIAMPT